MNSDNWETGLQHLQQPIWPLTKLCILLYLTSPYSTWKELLDTLPQELAVNEIIYQAPASKLTAITWPTSWLEMLKNGANANGLPLILNENHEHLDIFSSILCLIKQQVMEAELETVNSLFCSSMKCALCCEGPKATASQKFFEIPLQFTEVPLFEMQVIDTTLQGAFDAYSFPAFQRDGIPFYSLPSAIYRWRNGYSLILTTGATCPHLTRNLRCDIYKKRPVVCKKPQIFAYIMEKLPDKPHIAMERNILLAVTDCPYVRRLENELERYAVLNEVTLMLKPNKA